jgi:hypothetical protein
MVVLALRVRTDVPGGGTGPSGRIGKAADRLVPSERAPVLHERLAPVFALTVSAGIDELFELPVGHLVLVNPVLRYFHGTGIEIDIPACDAHHPAATIGGRHERYR